MVSAAENALDRVYQRIARPKLARALRISREAIRHWTRVPIERVPEVSDLTGLPPHEIRPDLPRIFPPPEPSMKDRPFGAPP